MTQKMKFGLISDCHGSSNRTEIAALLRLTKRRKDDSRAIACVHSFDSKPLKVIRNANCEIAEYYDLTHITKAHDRK